MKILIGVDNSDCSKAAVDFIRNAHWPPETRVTVLSAARPPVILSTEVYAPGLTYSDDLMKRELEMHRAVAAAAQKSLLEFGINADVRVTVGDPRTEIVETAEKENTDLVVVGSHGRTGLSKLLLGSVASYVTTHSPCSVLVVKRRIGH